MKAFFIRMFGWLFAGSQVKFVAGTIFLFVITALIGFIPALISAFVDTAAINSAIGSLPSGVLYFVNIFNVFGSLQIILAAYVARFLVRRLPFVG